MDFIDLDLDDNNLTKTTSLSKYVNNKSEYLNSLKVNDLKFNDVNDSLQNVKDKYQSIIANSLGKKNELKVQIDEVKSSTNDIKSAFQTNDVAIDEITDDVTDYTSEIEAIRTKLCELRKDKAQIQAMIDKRIQELEGLHDNTDVWRRKLMQFETLLGLKFVNEDGALKITFTNLSISDPERTCKFTIKLVKNRFSGLYCDPPIEQFDNLICDLNNGLEFGLFLCYMRKAFKTVV